MINNSLDNEVLLECYRKGMTDKAIALHAGCPTRTVTSRRRALGLPSLFRKYIRQRATPERLDLQYANNMERYYDELAELNHDEYQKRKELIRQTKIRLGTKYIATRELKTLFGAEPKNTTW